VTYRLTLESPSPSAPSGEGGDGYPMKIGGVFVQNLGWSEFSLSDIFLTILDLRQVLLRCVLDILPFIDILLVNVYDLSIMTTLKLLTCWMAYAKSRPVDIFFEPTLGVILMKECTGRGIIIKRGVRRTRLCPSPCQADKGCSHNTSLLNHLGHTVHIHGSQIKSMFEGRHWLNPSNIPPPPIHAGWGAMVWGSCRKWCVRA
jgi:hypothetical protein